MFLAPAHIEVQGLAQVTELEVVHAADLVDLGLHLLAVDVDGIVAQLRRFRSGGRARQVAVPLSIALPVVAASSLGAVLAIVAASVLFSWFIGMSSRYALVYGSLASLIILLVWLYLCGNLLLLGTVVGRVLENRTMK